MKRMLAPLSPFEETALRKIGFGTGDSVDPAHVKRLLHLELIEWNGWRWHLTSTGRQRYHGLIADHGSDGAPSA
jgi:hypothetical protein